MCSGRGSSHVGPGPAQYAISTRLESWGLRVLVGDHVVDHLEYLAGSDEDRLSDLNTANGIRKFERSLRLKVAAAASG